MNLFLFFDKIDSLVNEYIPPKEIKNRFKFYEKRDKKIIKATQLDIKQEYIKQESQYKTLRNQIVKLCRDSSQYISKLFFEVMPAILKTLRKASTK